MSEHTKVTAAGEVILPKHVSEGRGWTPGTELEIDETPQGVVVRAVAQPAPDQGFDYEAFRRAVPKHEGPPLTLEQMNEAIDRAMAERWASKEANSR